MRKVIIDTDPGIDDAYAILAALLNPELDVLGITCVSGNKAIDTVVANALRLKRFTRSNVKVYKGALTNLKNLANNTIEPMQASKVHGGDGLGNVNLPYDISDLETESAVDFILYTINKYPDEVEILALGPLTNIALCVQKDLAVTSKLKAIYTMGGGIDRGNITPYAEYNYYFDELATAAVFENLQENVAIYMIGLNATHSTRVDHNDLAFMLYEGNELGKLIFDMTQVYATMYYKNNGYLGAVIHDIVAYLYMIDPTIATNVIDDVYIEVMCDPTHKGQTKIITNKKAKVQVVMSCDRKDVAIATIKAIFPTKIDRYLEVIAK